MYQDNDEEIEVLQTDSEDEEGFNDPATSTWPDSDIEVMDQSEFDNSAGVSGYPRRNSNLESTQVDSDLGSGGSREKQGDDPEVECEDSVSSSQMDFQIPRKLRLVSPVWKYRKRLAASEQSV